MNLVGQKVKHKVFGVGMISSQDDEGHITVDFATKQSLFKYPMAFDGFLVAQDESVQKEIEKVLDAIKAEEAAQKANRQAEDAQRRANAAGSGGSYTEKEQRIVKRVEGQALTFFVFMGTYFEPEAELGLVWAPLYKADGFPAFYWDSLLNIREGDIIFHGSAGCIKAISRAKGSYEDCINPFLEQEGDLTYKDGRKVDCEYTVLKNPIATADYRDDIIKYCQVKYAPFDKNGNGNQGFLYDLDVKLAAVFLKGIVEKNPEVAKLDYVQWLLEYV